MRCCRFKRLALFSCIDLDPFAQEPPSREELMHPRPSLSGHGTLPATANPAWETRTVLPGGVGGMRRT